MEEISHKDIYDRLVAVESKVDKIDNQTAEVVAAFQNWQNTENWCIYHRCRCSHNGYVGKVDKMR